MNLDNIVVMGYRNFAGTADCAQGEGLICADQDEIAYADSIHHNGDILVGVETQLGQIAPISFADQAELDAQSQLVTTYFSKSKSFGGFAIDYYKHQYLSGEPGAICMGSTCHMPWPQLPPDILSVTGAPPTIDGILAPGEWNKAATADVTIVLEDGSAAPSTLFVMNDNKNLYLGLKVPRTSLGASTVAFQFDNNNNGIAEIGDDALVLNPDAGFFDEARTNQPPCPTGPICVLKDTDVGGTQDGQGATTNNGSYSFYEMSHPLDSGDRLHDFSLKSGSVVGFSLQVRFCSITVCPAADTFFPAPGHYGTIKIK